MAMEISARETILAKIQGYRLLLNTTCAKYIRRNIAIELLGASTDLASGPITRYFGYRVGAQWPC